MWELSLWMSAYISSVTTATELYLIALGYKKRPAIYGSVIFSQDDWVKR